jgi:hypothetical protein
LQLPVLGPEPLLYPLLLPVELVVLPVEPLELPGPHLQCGLQLPPACELLGPP